MLRKEGMAWYSSRPMTSLWSLPKKKRESWNGKVVISVHVRWRRCSCGLCLTSVEIISNFQKTGIASLVKTPRTWGGGGGAGSSLAWSAFGPHDAWFPLHRKKKDREFSVPSRDVTTKLSLGGNNDVITELFLPRGNLVSDIPAGDGKLVNLFYGVLSAQVPNHCPTSRDMHWSILLKLVYGFTPPPLPTPICNNMSVFLQKQREPCSCFERKYKKATCVHTVQCTYRF